MVLAHVLRGMHLKLGLAHVNFGLRGPQSEQDQALVQEWAQRHKLPFFTERAATREAATESGWSIQMAARELRYQFFAELLSSGDWHYLVLAHHADDSLESIFLNLGRGRGLRSLAGIPPQRGKVIRPFWLQSKREIAEYARLHKVRWREDLSNREDHYQRNFIRHHVLTPLRESFPHFESSFRHTLENTWADRNLFDQLLREKLAALKETTARGSRLAREHLGPDPASQALFYHWLRPHGPFDWAAIHALGPNARPGKIFDSPTHRLLLDRHFWILEKQDPIETAPVLISREQGSLTAPLSLRFAFKKPSEVRFPLPQHQVALDADKLSFPIELRPWQEGYSFVPHGMKGRKKLSDFLVDEKISRFDKERTWVLCNGPDICWVVGHRSDERYKVTPKTKSLYFVELI